MALDCPRCAVPMEHTPAAPPEGPVLSVDRCPRCGGLWLERDEIEHVVPELCAVEKRLHEPEVRNRRGTGIAACPSCFTAPIEVPHLGVPVDCCPSCKGLWLDGDDFAQPGEREAQARAERLDQSAFGYRASARERPSDVFHCVGCDRETPLKGSYMCRAGGICAYCHAQLSIRAKQREIAEQVTIGAPPAGVVVSRSLGELLAQLFFS